MGLPPEKLAELQAERDWILWKMEDSEYSYLDSQEYKMDIKRLSEIKALLKITGSKKSVIKENGN